MLLFSFFFFNDTAPSEIYTLSLHDALPIYRPGARLRLFLGRPGNRAVSGQHSAAALVLHDRAAGHPVRRAVVRLAQADRKSTRLNSSHQIISYAVFCLKKKKMPTQRILVLK